MPILASASPARLAVLRAAGIVPLVQVSAVDEDAVARAQGPFAPPAEVVCALAAAKAHDVAKTMAADPALRGHLDDAVLIGCDSMLHIGDRLEGKPGTVEVARARWQAMRGGEGELITGHAVLRIRQGRVVDEAVGHRGTVVRFGDPSPADLEAYLATGEPLRVAGAFTLDGLGGWFVDGIDGDPSSVIGISLPLTRALLERVGVTVAELWSARD